MLEKWHKMQDGLGDKSKGSKISLKEVGCGSVVQKYFVHVTKGYCELPQVNEVNYVIERRILNKLIVDK